ncbi:kinase-like domain-containing protein [Gilbertella persicaria]|uniref:kinase-like domain-containing protein n=1 Tax=Gilbertella persicaria TaxID=101096 RepID=UPI00221E70BB|nr:kinase-like domain-containing protein [Gilbertella persicaria]KAI8050149.1 kinase-like domain-containing protein [Gilbertella persicaria]
MSSAFYSFINSITNSITSRYDIKNQISTAGLWKIYQGERKTTGQKVALFIFEKKTLDISFKRDRNASKHDTEQVYELLKKEAGNLARLRHPSILEVVEPVSESRSSIVFVTEPLMGSLTHLVKNSENYSSDAQKPSLDLDELEIQKGLLQVGKGLQFLSDAKVVHHNLTTDAIFVNAKGDWKIGGLGHSVFLNTGNSNELSYEQSQDYLPEACQINLDYAAPEFVLDNDLCQANDMFALGCLAYAVHNKGVSLLKTFNSFHAYENQIKALASHPFQHIPMDLQSVIRSLLTRRPNQRMDPTSFQNSRYFDNLLVSTMKFLESFPEKTREEKAQFMKGLARVLGQFPERVLKKKILPSLLEELKDYQLLPFTIPNVFIITQKLSQNEFCDLVLPSLKPVFNIRDPPQNMIVLLEKLDVLQQKTPREVFRDDVMPLVYAALEAPTAVVQEKALRIIPSLAESLDYTAVKSSLFPRVQTLFVQTTILSVKVSTLICFHAMIKVLDKFTVQEKLVPVLKNIKTKEPAVMLATLAVYDEVGKIADKEIIATEILPQLWRMSFGPLLNLEQFQKFMKTIRDLTNRVEEAHVKHLREVKSLEEQTRSVSASASPQIASNPSPRVGETEISFESLVSGGKAIEEHKNDDDVFGSMVQNSTLATNVINSTSAITPQQKPATSTWTSAPLNLQPRQANTWSSLSPIKSDHTMTPSAPMNNTWSRPSTNTSNNSNSNNNNNNNNTWSQKPMNTAWSQTTIQPLALPPSQNNMASLNGSFNNITLNSNSSPNYNALQSLSNTNTTPQSMMPLSSSMGLLKPISSPTTTATKPHHAQLSKANLHAFDPLG